MNDKINKNDKPICEEVSDQDLDLISGGLGYESDSEVVINGNNEFEKK